MADNITLNLMNNVKPDQSKDPRKLRRIIAEDPEWNLATVPTLVDICLKNIVQNFSEKPLLDELLPRHQTNLLKILPVTIPLSVTANLIQDEGYWQRCCKARWEVCNVLSYGKSWKRMFFERNLEELIESYMPGTTDIKTIQEISNLSGKYIKSLKIGQLLSAIRKQEVDEDRLSDSEEDEPPPVDHFDFNITVPSLAHLEELQITYGVRDCGMNFEWYLFEFTKGDCTTLANAVKSWKKLKTFNLLRSKMDDIQARTIISNLLDHPSLTHLDFSYNKLSDNSGRAIGKLLNGHSHLVTLYLDDNNISGHGAGAIAHALKKNTTLKKLSLRHNRLEDEGCVKMCQALISNYTLTELYIGSNGITESSAVQLGQLLIHNKTLLSLNLSCNILSVNAGKILRESIEENNVITSMDLRLTEVGQECEYDISQGLKKNKEYKRKCLKK